MLSVDFAPLFRSTVGFDHLANLLETASRLAEANPGYPPYDIERIGPDPADPAAGNDQDRAAYRITMAVAGFSESDLSVELKEGVLVVSGRRSQPEGEAPRPTYLHHGIADRPFERRFQLADHVRVTGASLRDGLLSIDLVREVPETRKPRRIEIGTGTTGTGQRLVEGSAQAA